MGYVNCGAYVNGSHPKTKKALKEAMVSDPANVVFVTTSAFEDERAIQGDDIPTGAILSVVGPDPYEKRSWYATVKNGRVT